MSFKPDNVDHESYIEMLLEQIIKQLKLLNERIEEANETGITEEDVY
jgi:hypothetical protein